MPKSLTKERREAIRLRLQGLSYSQIKQALHISKSSLSLWLKDYPLSAERIKVLRDNNHIRIEKYRNTMRAKKETRQDNVYQKERERLLPISADALVIAGLFLYWGEGAKTRHTQTCLSNTDPKIVQFFTKWLINIMRVEKQRIRVRLHLYSDMNPEQEMVFWSKTLDIPSAQFYKPYIKQSSLQGVTFRGYGHGTCNVSVNDRDLTERILAGVKVIGEETIL